MATRQYAANVVIGGALKSSFKSTFGAATDAVKKLGGEIKKLSKQRADIKAFKNTQEGLGKLNGELATAKGRLDAARAALASAAAPTAKLTNEVARAERAYNAINKEIGQENDKLATLKKRLEEARISTNNLEGADAKLERRIASMTRRIGNHQKAQEKFDKSKARLGGAVRGGVMIGGAALAAFTPAVRASNAFADSMVDVGKYVDGLDTEEKLKAFGESIRDIARNSPLGAKGVTDLVIGAGKLGMKAPEALEFAKAMETMAGGLDLTSEEAATMLTKIKSGMRLTIGETLRLGDAMNYLGDVTASDSKNIVDIIQRQGSVIKATTKLTDVEIAALAASFDVAAPSAEAAATAMKNFTKALTIGKASTRSTDWAYQMLKLNPEKVAEGMQKDAKATIGLVLERLGKVADKDQGAILSKLFGEESKGVISNVITSYDDLLKSFKAVGDESNFLGRSAQEQQRNLEKWGVQSKILGSQINDLGIEIGDTIKECLAPLAKWTIKILKGFATWRKENPKLFKTLTAVAVVGVTVAVALAGIGIAVSAVMVAWSGLQVAWTALLVMGGPTIAFFGTLAAVVIGAALLIRKYWEPISAFFKGVWDGIVEGWNSAGGPALWESIKGAFNGAGSALLDFLKPVKMTPEEFAKVTASGKEIGKLIGETLVAWIKKAQDAFAWLGEAIAGIKGIFEEMRPVFGEIGEVIGGVATKIQQMWEPIFNWFAEKFAWITSKVEGLKAVADGFGKLKDGGVEKFFEDWGSRSYENNHGTGPLNVRPAKPNGKETSMIPGMRGGGSSGPININVNAAPGQSEEAVAQAVMRRLKNERTASGGFADDALAA